MTFREIIHRSRDYFNLRPHKGDEDEIVDQINSGITFRGGNLWVLIFAILIASLGLNVNSTAVIIGAMLISPLMGPIIGMGFALGTNDLDMLRRSAKNYVISTIISILTATIYWFITPLTDAQSELLARTSPTLYDVLIAFCGGAAGIIALGTGGKSNVIPGVAIATALMPPLCTAGYGLGTGNMHYFLGAFYLFVINTVFICISTVCGVKLMHFKTKVFLSTERAKRVRRIITTIVVITVIPAAIMTATIVKNSIFDHNVSRFVKSELSQVGTQVLSTDVDKDSRTLSVVAVGRDFSEAFIHDAESQLAHFGLEDYRLSVIQGAQSDSLLMLNSQLSQVIASREDEHKKMLQMSSQNSQYEQQLAEYVGLEELADELTDETKVLFPSVKSVALSRVRQSSPQPVDSKAAVDADTEHAYYVVAVVETSSARPLGASDSQRLKQWLKTRTSTDSIAVFIVRRN